MLYGLYFSPTDNSKKYVEAMAKAIEENSIFFDVTSKEEAHVFLEEDFLIIGAPVYGGRIPGICKERFSKFKGTKTPCILVATFGNRHYDDALMEMKDLFEANGFIVYGACALIGRHTYGSIAINRPDYDDLNQAKQYALEIYQRNQPLTDELPGKHHENKIINKGKFIPSTNSSCIQCQICLKGCPVGAIDSDCVTINDQCISCFSCIRHCPMQAKEMKDENYIAFADMFTEKLKERKENVYFK